MTNNMAVLLPRSARDAVDLSIFDRPGDGFPIDARFAQFARAGSVAAQGVRALSHAG
jgi:hypothetical protein